MTSHPSQNQIQDLERRLANLEGEARDIRTQLNRLQSAASSAGSAAREPAPAPTPVQPRPVKKPGRSAADLELFSGNLLGKLGMLALILTAGWFIKYAFDNYWINESGRIYTGLFCGYLVMAGGLQLARRRYRYLPGPVIGTGMALLYIAVFGAYYFYGLLGLSETFALLFVLSAAGAWLSLAANNQLLYTFSLAGAYLAPLMLSRGENSYRFLFVYLLVVNAGFFYISTRRAWRVAPYLVTLASAAVFAGWFFGKAADSSLPVPFAFVALSFALLLYRETVLMPRQRKTITVDSVLLVVLLTVLYLTGAYGLLDLFYPAWVPHLFLATAGLLLGAYVLYDRKGRPALESEDRRWMNTALLGLALPLLVAAPYHLYGTGEWLVLMIAFAGACSIAGALERNRLLHVASLLLWLYALVLLVFVAPPADGWPLFNIRFSVFLLAAVLLAGTYFVRRSAPGFLPMPVFLYLSFAVVIAGSLAETHDLIDSRHYRNLGYSITLLAYAAGFLGVGFYLRRDSVRYAGMVLAGIVVLKFYLYDIWTLSRLVRILAGFFLGVGLVTVSILYQKFRGVLFPEQTGDSSGDDATGGNAGGSGRSVLLMLFLGTSLLLPGSEVFARDGSPFRAASYRFTRPVVAPAATRTPEGRPFVYGRLELDETLVRLAGENDLRLTAAGRTVPYFRRAIPLDDRNSGQVRPNVIFDQAGKSSRVYVLKLPPPPADTEFYQLVVQPADGADFETSVGVSHGDTPDALKSAGTHSLYRYETTEPAVLSLRIGRAGYVRLAFHTREAFRFPAARYRSTRLSDEYAVPVELDDFRREYDTDLDATVYYYENEGRRKVHRVEMTFQEERYRRSIDVQYIPRTSRTYSQFFSGNLSAGREGENKRQVIAFPQPISEPFKLIVYEEDNPPLSLTTVELFAPREEIIFELPTPDSDTDAAAPDLRLYYGNPYALYPSYDLDDTYDEKLPHLKVQPGEHSENADFAYSIMEPPVSIWMIRALFFLGLIGVLIPGVRILKKYVKETEE